MTELTPEILAMYEALQPKFRETMGPVIDLDIFYCPACKDIHLMLNGLLSKCRCITRFTDMLRLPLAINDRNPGRGLLGMIQGTGKYLCLNQGSKKWRFSVEQNDHDIATSYFGATPTEALLRALMAQEVK
jgi:hypothetical protein